MPRTVLDETRIHPAIRDKIAHLHADFLAEVQAAIDANPVLVVGMQGNPHCGHARKALQAAGVAFKYLQYGSYLSQWRLRNSLKMWTGWPTFPMVFVKGALVGGASDLDALISSGELQRLLGR
jgi:monothiol glutaredoxin